MHFPKCTSPAPAFCSLQPTGTFMQAKLCGPNSAKALKRSWQMQKEDNSRPGKKWKEWLAPWQSFVAAWSHFSVGDDAPTSGNNGTMKMSIHRQKNCVCRTAIDEVPCNTAKQSPNLASRCFGDVHANNQMHFLNLFWSASSKCIQIVPWSRSTVVWLLCTWLQNCHGGGGHPQPQLFCSRGANKIVWRNVSTQQKMHRNARHVGHTWKFNFQALTVCTLSDLSDNFQNFWSNFETFQNFQSDFQTFWNFQNGEPSSLQNAGDWQSNLATNDKFENCILFWRFVFGEKMNFWPQIDFQNDSREVLIDHLENKQSWANFARKNCAEVHVRFGRGRETTRMQSTGRDCSRQVQWWKWLCLKLDLAFLLFNSILH